MDQAKQKDLVKLSLLNGKALTFDPVDYMKLRTDHRIVAKLIGVPVSNARNSQVNGLPAFYNEYEVQLLLEKGVAILDDKTGLKDSPSNEVKLMYEQHQQKIIAELHKPYIDSKLKSTIINMESIIRGKTKKLINSGIPESEIVITPEIVIEDETTKHTQAMKSKAIFMQVPTQHPFEVTSRTFTDLTVGNVRKYKVFKDLWNKGFYITTGDSFGCDFLTYPGDPINFHASQIVNVVDPNKQIDIKFLVSCARLSVSVKKKCVFAYANDDTVTYQTLQWDNPKFRKLYPMNPESSQSQDREGTSS